MRTIVFPLSAALVLMLLLTWTLPSMAAETTMIKVGEKAPDFSLPDQSGRTVSLKDFAGKTAIVLYFYPKDDVGVCKKEACLFRDDYRSFVDAGAEVIGISSDSVQSHQDFAKKRELPFRLLSDSKGTVRSLYGVPKAAGGLLPGRVTFVIDRQGIVRMTFNSLLNADKHVSEALRVIKEIH
jgi:peroxiredoxin Q/BCP